MARWSLTTGEQGECSMARQITIYAICNHATGEAYIGETVVVGFRWVEHRSALRHGRHHNRALQVAWQRDGESAFGLFVLECVRFSTDFATATERRREESRWLDRARSAGVVLYNDQVGRRRAA